MSVSAGNATYLPTVFGHEDVIRWEEILGHTTAMMRGGAMGITFTFDEKSYDIYYGYRGSLDSMGSDEQYPILSSMNINEEE